MQSLSGRGEDSFVGKNEVHVSNDVTEPECYRHPHTGRQRFPWQSYLRGWGLRGYFNSFRCSVEPGIPFPWQHECRFWCYSTEWWRQDTSRNWCHEKLEKLAAHVRFDHIFLLCNEVYDFICSGNARWSRRDGVHLVYGLILLKAVTWRWPPPSFITWKLGEAYSVCPTLCLIKAGHISCWEVMWR